MSSKKTILIVAEAVTLAHVARAKAVAQGLFSEPYRIVLAWDPKYKKLAPDNLEFYPLSCLDSADFISSANNYKFPYSEALLKKYVEDEMQLIEAVHPDLIIGDFRFTLSISARKMSVPYFSIANSYWLPEAPFPQQAPDHLLLRPWPKAISRKIFRTLGPLIFHLEAQRFNKIADFFGVSQAKGSLLKVYTQADHILLAEPVGWVEDYNPGHSSLIGPLIVTLPSAPPSWWEKVDWQKPTIYISVGSSGSQDLIEQVVEATKGMKVQLIISGLGEELPSFRGRDIFYSSFIANAEVMERAQLMISNGGSLSMVDAFRYGRPVIGISSNFDQYLNAGYIEDKGLGRSFLQRRLKIAELRAAIEEHLNPTIELQGRLDEIKRIFSPNESGMTTLRSVVRENLAHTKTPYRINTLGG